MREQTGDLFQVAAQDADALVITTNGFVKNDGSAVMGRGVAKQAADRWPWLPRELGFRLNNSGNHVYAWRPDEHLTGFYIVTFPVKHHWREMADTQLIGRSADELVLFARAHEDVRTVVMPRPGCGNGGLLWLDATVVISGTLLVGVKGLVEDRLDDRFVVVCNEEQA